jgi:hypothetical protein
MPRCLKTMLQELIVYGSAVAEHKQLCCGPLAKATVAVLQIVQEDYNVLNCRAKVLGSIPQHCAEASVLNCLIMRHKMPNLNMVLVLQDQFRVSDCHNGLVREQGDVRAVGKDDTPSMRAC